MKRYVVSYELYILEDTSVYKAGDFVSRTVFDSDLYVESVSLFEAYNAACDALFDWHSEYSDITITGIVCVDMK